MLYLIIIIKYETTLVIQTQHMVSWQHRKCLGISSSLWHYCNKAPPEHVIRNELKSLSSLVMVDSVGQKNPGRAKCTRFFVLVQSVTYGTHQADSKMLIFRYTTLNTKNVFKTAWEVLTITVHMPHSSKAPNSYSHVQMCSRS